MDTGIDTAPPAKAGETSRADRRRGRGPILLRGGLVVAAGLSIAGGLSYSSRNAPGRPAALPVAGPALVQRSVPSLDHEAVNLLRGAILASLAPPAETASQPIPAATPEIPGETIAPLVAQEPVAPADTEASAAGRLAQTVPLPVARPPELRGPVVPPLSRRAERQARRGAVAADQAPPEHTRSFFDKLFGVAPAPASPALAYAALEQPPAATALPRQLSPAPTRPSGAGIAVYDITARTVTLPNGERLEAHSGLGESMDDPRSVATRMRGATPPGVYDLTEREALFHGVRAIRLNPVGGAAAIYGRAGLLAHTYMLGPSGASNGCVSFRDYNRFLQAFLSGQVARLVVVSGNGQDVLPSIATKAPARTARVGGDT